jgi:hypothetical protein
VTGLFACRVRAVACNGVKVELGDVRDVRAYVCAIVNRRFRSALESHGDEIISEGVAVMFELHERWIEKAPAETFQHFSSG